MEPAPGEQADQNSHAEGDRDQRLNHIEDLIVPLPDTDRTPFFGVLRDGPQILTDLIHQCFSVEIETDIVGLTAGFDRCDDGQGEGVMPVLVLVAEVFDTALLNGVGVSDCAEIIEFGLNMAFSLMKIGQKAIISGDLITSQAGLLIGDQLGNLGCLGNPGIGVLDKADGFVGASHLPIKSSRGNQQGNDRKQEDLPQDSIELSQIHVVSPLRLLRADD